MYAFGVWYPRLLLFTRTRAHLSARVCFSLLSYLVVERERKIRILHELMNRPHFRSITQSRAGWSKSCHIAAGGCAPMRSFAPSCRLCQSAQRAKLSAVPKCAARQVVGCAQMRSAPSCRLCQSAQLCAFNNLRQIELDQVSATRVRPQWIAILTLATRRDTFKFVCRVEYSCASRVYDPRRRSI